MSKDIPVSFSFHHMDGSSPCGVSVGVLPHLFRFAICPSHQRFALAGRGTSASHTSASSTSTNKKMIVLTDGAAAMLKKKKKPNLDPVLRFFPLIGRDCGVRLDSWVECGGAGGRESLEEVNNVPACARDLLWGKISVLNVK